MGKYTVVAAVMMLSLAASSFAQEDPFLRNEKRLTELERQLNLLRQENASLKRRIEVMSLPTSEAVEAYLQERGLAGVPIADESGKPASETVERIRLSGSFSSRFEYDHNRTDLSDASQDTGDFLYTRLKLGISYDLNDNVTLAAVLRGSFIGGGFAGINAPGDPASLNDIDTLDVYEAYVLFRDVNMFGRLGGHLPVSIQVGRQEFFYGDGFLLGNDSFRGGISYDGVRFIQESGRHRVDLLWAKLLENDFVSDSGVISPTSAGDDDADLVGLHLDMAPVSDTSVSVYALLLQSWGFSGAVPYGTFPEASLVTFGSRFQSSYMRKLSYSMEFAAQLGSIDDRDIQDSFALVGKVRYDGLGNPFRPYVSFNAVYAAGDKDPFDSEENSFSPLAQDPHTLLGGLDMFFTSNLKAAGGELGFSPLSDLTLKAAYYRYYANELSDLVGGWLAGGGSGNYVGQEWSLGLGWKIDRWSTLDLSYGEFLPGDFSAASDKARRLTLSVDVSF
ncbi:MAG: alginate export family protein [Planctomycetes bacterium]|nr:alginate export family protein [Planctomycetota bacterium]